MIPKYIEEYINKHPQLTAEENLKLWQDGKIELLASHNMRIAMKVAMKYYRHPNNIMGVDEIFAIASSYLVEACNNYNPEKHSAISTYLYGCTTSYTWREISTHLAVDPMTISTGDLLNDNVKNNTKLCKDIVDIEDRRVTDISLSSMESNEEVEYILSVIKSPIYRDILREIANGYRPMDLLDLMIQKCKYYGVNPPKRKKQVANRLYSYIRGDGVLKKLERVKKNM